MGNLSKRTRPLRFDGLQSRPLPGREMFELSPVRGKAEDCTCPSLSGVRTEDFPLWDEGKQRFE